MHGPLVSPDTRKSSISIPARVVIADMQEGRKSFLAFSTNLLRCFGKTLDNHEFVRIASSSFDVFVAATGPTSVLNWPFFTHWISTGPSLSSLMCTVFSTKFSSPSFPTGTTDSSIRLSNVPNSLIIRPPCSILDEDLQFLQFSLLH